MSLGTFRLDGKVALVTGASRGIGAAIAQQLAVAGATVVVNYKGNKELADKVVADLRQVSPKSVAVGFDIADPASIEKGLEEIQKQFEKLDILVANAGISRDQLLLRATPELFEEVIKTNLLGTMNMVRAVSRGMLKNRYGRIVCISSVIGEMGNKGQSAYAASKSGLFGFAKSVALELGSRNITCNVICPGFIETDMTTALDEPTKARYFERIPAGRFAKPAEVAYAVQFLASDEASYITGATLDINGGLLMT